MQKKLYPVVALLGVIASILACASPLGSGEQLPAPNEIETIVAATLQALTPVSSSAEATATSAPAGLLPHNLYFINNDSAGIAQIFSLGTDGVTVIQLTFEPAAVNSYDISIENGSIAYVANNQLLLINADGSGRRMLADGGPIDLNNPFITSLTSPVFSPNGETIAYSNRGLNLYAVATSVSNVVLQQLATDPISGASVPSEMYIPQEYSPDGTKLLITAAIPNSDGISSGIYFPAAGSLVRLSGGDGARLCCSRQAWAPDSSALYVGISSVGMFGSGLWRVDAASGNLTTLLPTDAGGGVYNLAAFPYPAPDGNLYFFYNTATSPDGMINRAPLQLVRSGMDGVSSRTSLRPETFEFVNEALWAPDASFVIVARAPAETIYAGGVLELYYTDGAKSMVSLVPFGQQLKWGR